MNRNAKRKAAQARRNVLLVVALMLVVCVASIGGTIAWLTDKTEAVTNTFSPSNIMIDLKEDYPTNGIANMIPGGVIAKNPTATISNDVDAYLFVKIDESTDPDLDNYIDWEIADGWKLLELVSGAPDATGDRDVYVYYREVSKGANQEFGILDGNKVSVLPSVTKTDMAAIANNKPTLSFTAYAIQKESGNGATFTAEEAWRLASAN